MCKVSTILKSMLAVFFITTVGWSLQTAFAAQADRPNRTQFFLVSMGNGDPDNITLRAINTVKKSDIIFCGQQMVDKFPILLHDKEIHDPGFGIAAALGKDREDYKNCKRPVDYKRAMDQLKRISKIIRDEIKKGKTVSVLTSGDPSIYGPSIWYMDVFKDLNPEIVPGVSCFNAANAALRKGVTYGQAAHSVILTATFGREDEYDGPDNVESLAKHKATMAFFTMFTDREKVIKKLRIHYPKNTPVAIVQHAGYRNKERVILGTLDTILDQLKDEEHLFEYMIYVGDFLSYSFEEK
jgi:precorrin-4/cobalt-precorrin-4 C11-methyltransferase